MTPAAMLQADVHAALLGVSAALVVVGAAIFVIALWPRRRRPAAQPPVVAVPLPTPKAPKPPLVYPTEILPPIDFRPPRPPAAPEPATQIIPRVTDHPDATAVFPRYGGTR